MPDESRFQGDWNANKGYLQLILDYIALFGQYNIAEDFWHEFKVVRQLAIITIKVIDPAVSEYVNNLLPIIEDKLKPQNIDIRTTEGQSMVKNLAKEAENMLRDIESKIVGELHTNNLILPRKQQHKGVKQLLEEYGLEDDDNTEGASEDNTPILQAAPEAPQLG